MEQVVLDPVMQEYVLFLLERFMLDWPPELVAESTDYVTFVIQFSEFLNAFKGVL